MSDLRAIADQYPDSEVHNLAILTHCLCAYKNITTRTSELIQYGSTNQYEYEETPFSWNLGQAISGIADHRTKADQYLYGYTIEKLNN